MHKKIAALVLLGVLVAPFIVSCGGGGTLPKYYAPPSTLATELNGSTDPAEINAGIGDAVNSASGRSSAYTGLSINPALYQAFALGQSAFLANGSDSLTFDQAYTKLAATKAISLPTEPQLLTELNSEIAAGYANQSNPNSVVPIFISTSKSTLPTEPPTLTGSTTLGSVQLLMLCIWLPTEPASPALARDDSPECEIAKRNLAIAKFCVAISVFFGLTSTADGQSEIQSAQQNANDLCDPQGGN
jgi:hypothetical protein